MRRVEDARRVIAEARTHGRVAISVSGGKDSLVTWHLVRTVDPSAPAAWFDSGAELTGTEAYVRDVLGATRIAPVRDLPDMCRYAGWWGYRTPTDPTATFDVLETLIYEPSARVLAETGCTVMAIGLRGEESVGRRWSARRRGALYFSEADGVWHCCPLASWSTADVWAYIASRDLPYHWAYDAMAAQGMPRREQRIGTVLGGKTASFGSIARTKRIDPTLYNRLAAEFPLWAAEG